MFHHIFDYSDQNSDLFVLYHVLFHSPIMTDRVSKDAGSLVYDCRLVVKTRYPKRSCSLIKKIAR